MEIRINLLQVAHCTSIAQPIENCYNLLSFACLFVLLLIRLKKYLNPHENSCSKVISILTTGNILHESSSAPRQHKSVQYKWFSLYFHRDVSHTDMLQPHFISCRGVSGVGGNMRGVQRGFIIFQGGVKLFQGGGANANFFRNPYTYLLFSGGGGVRTPYLPLDPHMGNIIITGQYLSQPRF